MECIKCKISNNESVVNCDSCERPIHIDCSGLNASELKVMSLRGKRLLRFHCEDCQVGVRLVPKLIKKIDEMFNEMENLKHQFKQTYVMPTSMDENIINEMQERQKRQNNVMIFNLVESGSEDPTIVNNIITELTSQSLETRNIKRIGKKNKNGWRAVRVEFSRAEDADKVIKAKKDTLKGKKIFVNADLTPHQTSKIKTIRKEIEERNSRGESVGMKFVNGTPTIVQAKLHNTKN